jgi:hypothetical protein
VFLLGASLLTQAAAHGYMLDPPPRAAETIEGTPAGTWSLRIVEIDPDRTPNFCQTLSAFEFQLKVVRDHALPESAFGSLKAVQLAALTVAAATTTVLTVVPSSMGL